MGKLDRERAKKGKNLYIQTGNVRMKPESRQILAEYHRRQIALESSEPPPSWKWWAVEERNEQLAHGPAYASGGWFPGVEEHVRVRYLRGITSLEKGGLLTTHRKHERRLSHIKLTPAGMALAETLLLEDGEK